MIGSLFSGSGMLDDAVSALYGEPVAWHVENDPGASAVLAARRPDVPNLGDVRNVHWGSVTRPSILAGGFPCQDVSCGGRREGLSAATRSGLWTEMARAIDALRPEIVVVENVRGLLHAYAHRAMEPGEAAVGGARKRSDLRAFGAVLGDLCDLGYDAQWEALPAANVGAPHRRLRVFVTAHRAGQPQRRLTVRPLALQNNPFRLLPTPEAKNSHASQDYARASRPDSGGDDLVTAIVKAIRDDTWARYLPAVEHWEFLTRPAPAPVEPNSKGNPRINAAFAEWMMGWPRGYATDVDGVDRRAQLKIIGNGVVPQQAVAALARLAAGAPE